MTSSLSEADFGVLGSRYSDATSHAVVPVADFRKVKELDLRVCVCVPSGMLWEKCRILYGDVRLEHSSHVELMNK